MLLESLLPTILGSGYIAGSGDGIVTVAHKPAIRKVFLLNAEYMTIEQTTISLSNGHYLFTGLDPNKEYMVIARDHKKQFEPCAWDRVKPATDLTHQEQMTLWQSWQTN